MEEVFREFKTAPKACRADRKYYRSLIPEQCIAILLQLVDDYYGHQQDRKALVELFNSTGVGHFVAGAYGLAHHDHPRLTGDIDFSVRWGRIRVTFSRRALAYREFQRGAGCPGPPRRQRTERPFLGGARERF